MLFWYLCPRIHHKGKGEPNIGRTAVRPYTRIHHKGKGERVVALWERGQGLSGVGHRDSGQNGTIDAHR
jgi:hypothetical protein